MVRIVLVALAAALLSAAGASAKNPPFVGVWKGTVKTTAGATTPVVVTVTAKLKSNNSGNRTLWAAWYGAGVADPAWSGYVLLGGR